jgi:putative spermidine/putrescine transport system ATP-binding protein
MDEPLSNLDAKLRLEMRAEIRRIHDEIGAATIYVTHDQDEALSMADRIVVMREGMVRQIGTPRELYGAPAHLDVAEFMGFRNRLSGKVTALAGDRATVLVGPNSISGAVREPVQVGAMATVAVRPDDMTPVSGNGGFAATVTASEYRGRDFFGTARTAEGAELSFRAPDHIAAGSAIRLGAAEDRVLVYAGGA